jgi:hypothetical protein
MWFWIPIWVLIVVGIIALVGWGVVVAVNEDRRQKAESQGHRSGRKQGYDEGYQEGYAKGYWDGHEAGKKAERESWVGHGQEQPTPLPPPRTSSSRAYRPPPPSSSAPAYRAYASADRADRERLTKQTRSVEQFPNQRQLPRGS